MGCGVSSHKAETAQEKSGGSKGADILQNLSHCNLESPSEYESTMDDILENSNDHILLRLIQNEAEPT